MTQKYLSIIIIMSFNRLNYDTCTYKHNLRQSVGAGDYYLNTPRAECTACFPSNDLQFTKQSPIMKCNNLSLIDADSELLGITRRATNCPDMKYIPGSSNTTCDSVLIQDCRAIPNEPTRASNPPCTLRSSGWNRWEWLCKDPQDKALVPFDFNISNRIVVKDNHRPYIPKPINQSAALPPLNQDNTMHELKLTDCIQQEGLLQNGTWKGCEFFSKYSETA